MKALRQVRLAKVAATPWKNGGGLTRDLLLWPPSPARAADGWQLRISVAEVAQSGPFSVYPGVARWFCVLQGAGLVLRFQEGQHTLTPDSAPLHFDGALAPGCELVAGPTLDLNLMARQNAGRAEMGRAVAGVPWLSRAPLRALFTLGGATLEREGAAALLLPAGTLAYIGVTAQASAGEAWQLGAAEDSGWWLAFEPHAR